MIGVDEAGRGAWAGPFLAAAVRLIGNWSKAGLDDSKRLTPDHRRSLAGLLEAGSATIGWAAVGAAQVDAHGLSWAQTEAMRRAVIMLEPEADEEIIVDGSVNYLGDLYTASRAVVKADRRVLSVMAASILAKFKRDCAMVELDRLHPGYGFARHKGYGTLLHRRMIAKLGPLPGVHRFSYRPLAALSKEQPARSI